ncbi:MAG: DAK2 domain-containing protein [Actinobacteria bacterium]|nr:DAK2 domain-containing protein [Actinomycetota bacterium]NBY57713.1 DAK2 domain-containing protein [Actinomycetota bacterium]
MPVLEQLGPDALRHTLVTYRNTMKRHQVDINKLNVYPVPDGDTGTNMARTLDAVVAELEKRPGAIEETCNAISHGSLMGARGNSGVILSQILRGLASTLKSARDIGAPKVAEALKAASAAAYESVLKPIEGTILTVVRESADAAVRAAGDGATLAAMLRVARAAGRESLAKTPELLPVLKDAGVVDAGGAGFLLFLDSALHVVDGEPLPEPENIAGPNTEQLIAVMKRGEGDDKVDVSELRYEVMFLLELDDTKSKAFMQKWGEVGDSIVVVGGDGLYNCHIHTNDIGAAIEAPISLGGRPHQIRVTDLFEEVAEEHEKREAQIGAPSGADATTLGGTSSGGGATSRGGKPSFKTHAALPEVTCAVVAVASGDGIAELFGNLGVHGVVTGGQTLNPSTQELLDAVEHMNAQQVVILPNNKNIIPVAKQVDGLTKKEVRVVPTCSMPEALAALVAYDPEASAEHNGGSMAKAAAAVVTGEVTTAVRDTKTDAGAVKEGDSIGLVRGDGVVAIAADVFECSTALLKHIVSADRELLTIITGADAKAATTEKIVEWVGSHFPSLVCEVHRGGQPLYPYLFGVE